MVLRFQADDYIGHKNTITLNFNYEKHQVPFLMHEKRNSQIKGAKVKNLY